MGRPLLAIACSIIALTLLTGIIGYFTVGATLAPLRNIGEGMIRMRKGDYDHPILPSGRRKPATAPR